MALITKAIKGTKDVLPKDVHKNQYIEATALDVASKFGYKEIRTPVFEHTELFQRGVGDTTDLSLKTDFAMKHFRKRFAILHLVTDMKNRRQAG